MEASNRIMACLTVFSGFVRGVCSMMPGNCGQWKAHVHWQRSYYLVYESLSNDCRGSRYTTRYTIANSTYYIAAILCSNDRYKLLMKDSNDIHQQYRDISNLLGDGQDHCELVGMDEEYLAKVKIGYTRKNDDVKGIAYSRSRWHQRFAKGRVTLDKIPRWYECGISIPSSRKSYTQKDVHIKEKEQVNKGCRLTRNENDKEDKITQWDIIRMLFTYFGWVVLGAVVFCLCLALIIYCYVYEPCTKLTGWRMCYISSSCDDLHLHTPPAELPPAESLRSALSNHSPRPGTTASSPISTPLPSSPTAPPVPASPSAPPRAAPWGASAPSPPPAPLSRDSQDGGPPTYEEASNYPLIRAAEPEAPPPTYDDAALLDVQFTSI